MRISPDRAGATVLLLLAVAGIVGPGLSCSSAAAATGKSEQADTELQLGQEVFDQLRSQGVIVATSPLYQQLEPLAARITRDAQPGYEHPFHFYLVHQTQPNAFSTPGGNVYVADSLFSFVRNTEELAGTLCHEVAHTIHHDTVALMEARQRLALREVGAGVLLGPTHAHLLAIALLGKLNSLGYSREAESRADVTGSDICAAARYNPWGLVWLFSDFKDAQIGQTPELLSDHPDDEHRVRTLKEHFRKNSQVFGNFDPDAASATPLVIPADFKETFVR